MSADLDRLRNLLSDELGEYGDADVRDRIDALDELEASVPDDRDSDLAALAVLSDETRYRLARYLAAADDELCVCELSVIVDVGESATSHALRDLYRAGLVTRRRDEQWRYYETTERADRVLAALDETRGQA